MNTKDPRAVVGKLSKVCVGRVKTIAQDAGAVGEAMQEAWLFGLVAVWLSVDVT
jgi:hypothetical protein